MPDIYVDADACPVKEEIVRVADRHGLTVHMVSNSWMRLPEGKSVQRVVVSEGADVADDWIADRIQENDIAITTDIPLAARCLKKAARVLGPTGQPFTEEAIGMALAMRELNAHLRDRGEISGSGPGFTKKDRSRFLGEMENTIQAIRREA